MTPPFWVKVSVAFLLVITLPFALLLWGLCWALEKTRQGYR